MQTRWAFLVLLLLGSGCHTPGHGPAWDALVRAGQLAGEVSGADHTALSFRGSLPGPGAIADTPVILLIHGWCGDGSLWEPLDATLWSQRNVVALDLAAHGLSTTSRKALTLESFAGDVAELIDHLGLNETVLVGHGLGAQVALEAAALRPHAVVGVVAVEAFHDLSQEFTVEQATLMENAFTNDFEGTMNHYLDWLIGRDARATWQPRLAEVMTRVPLETALTTLQAAFVHDVREALVTLPVPLVLINGDQRPTDLEALRALVPFAAAEIVSDAGHFPHLEQPQAFGRALDTALNTLAALWKLPS